MRRALVNDLVHSFCYSCRAKNDDEGQSAPAWPCVVLGTQVLTPVLQLTAFDPRRLIPFVAYALATHPFAWAATTNIIKISDHLRRLTKQEQDYAIYLMERYYGCPLETRSNPNQSQLF